jgi:hypothetical protein
LEEEASAALVEVDIEITLLLELQAVYQSYNVVSSVSEDTV